MEKQQAIETAEEILGLYRQFGDQDYIGEPVSQIEHMCQCAQLAETQGFDEEVILAAFFHDIGHLCEQVMEVENMDGYGVVDHEKLGADYIKGKGFSTKIADLINSHVAAKRYLTFAFPEYYEQLSEASKVTLVHQGGVMTEEEAADFKKDPLFETYLVLRKWDEQAKLEHIPLPPLEHYKDLIVDHLVSQDNRNEA